MPRENIKKRKKTHKQNGLRHNNLIGKEIGCMQR